MKDLQFKSSQVLLTKAYGKPRSKSKKKYNEEDRNFEGRIPHHRNQTYSFTQKIV